MGVGWIDRVYVNTSGSWNIKSTDDHNNGALRGGGRSFDLNDRRTHQLKGKTMYSADWCGIPWYYQGKHFKTISKSSSGDDACEFFTSEIKDKNWLMFYNKRTGKEVARQEVPKGSDFHCFLRFEEDGVFFEIVNNHEFSAENAVFVILGAVKKGIDAAIEVGALLFEIMGGGKTAESK